jgi:hypothetical protein
LKCASRVVVGKILMSRILWNLFCEIWIQYVRDIDLKMISTTGNSNKFSQKPGFGRKNQLRR